MKRIFLAAITLLLAISLQAQRRVNNHMYNPDPADAQGTEINSRDLRGKVVYQDDEVVFRQLDEHTWIGNGHIKNMCREVLDGERKPTASNGNSGGMDMMVDDNGVRINFSSQSGMK